MPQIYRLLFPLNLNNQNYIFLGRKKGIQFPFVTNYSYRKLSVHFIRITTNFKGGFWGRFLSQQNRYLKPGITAPQRKADQSLSSTHEHSTFACVYF